MNVQFLASLIKSNQRVVVPGLGAFLHKENGVVVFSPFLNKDDGLLLSAICRHYTLSASSAQLELDGMVSEIKLAMTQIGKFYIDGIGILILNENGGMSLVEEGVANNGLSGGGSAGGRMESKTKIESEANLIPSIDPLLSRASNFRGAVNQHQVTGNQPVYEPISTLSEPNFPQASASPQFSQATQGGQSSFQQVSTSQQTVQSDYRQPQRVANQPVVPTQPVQSPVHKTVSQSQSTMPRAVGGVHSSGYSSPVSQIGRPVQPSWVPPIQPSSLGAPQVQPQSMQPRVSQPSMQGQRVQNPQSQVNNQRMDGAPQPQNRPSQGAHQIQTQGQPQAGPSTQPRVQPSIQGQRVRQQGHMQGQPNSQSTRMPNDRPAPQGSKPPQNKPNRAPQKSRQPQKGGQNRVDMWLLVAIVAAALVVILIIYGLIYTDPVNQIF